MPKCLGSKAAYYGVGEEEQPIVHEGHNKAIQASRNLLSSFLLLLASNPLLLQQPASFQDNVTMKTMLKGWQSQ
jgi:hypothetical protein